MIPGIVLSAGRSSRMGRPKANLAAAADNPAAPAARRVEDADTFLMRIVRTLLAAGIEDVVVIVGDESDAIRREFSRSGLPARFVENPDFASGQLSSLLAGLRIIDRPGVAAALVTLVDVPFVSTATVRAVVGRYLETRAPIVRPVQGGRHGHPMIVDRSLFGPLRQADPATGARPVVRAYATAHGAVEVDDAGAFADIDTQEEYEEALRTFGGDRGRTMEDPGTGGSRGLRR